MNTLVPRDEREAGIDLAADRLAYLVVSYGLLAVVAYRGLALGEASWDLLGLVILGGAVGLAYRLRKRVVSTRWAAVLVGTMVIAAVVAAASVVARLPR